MVIDGNEKKGYFRTGRVLNENKLFFSPHKNLAKNNYFCNIRAVDFSLRNPIYEKHQIFLNHI